jgi:predicted transcriptional regulator
MGRVYIHYIDNFDEILGSLNRHRDFIIDHEIRSIPVSHQAMIGLVMRGRDGMPANNLKPYRKNEFLKDQLKRSRRICAVLSTIVPEQLTAAIAAAKDGARIRAILTPEVLNSLKKDFFGLFEELSKCKAVEIFINDNAKISFAIADSILFLGLHRLDGSYDSENLIICDDEGSLVWAEAVFRHFLKGAKRENSLLH